MNEKLSATQLDNAVETYSSKPNNCGLSIDTAGNIYLTALETNSIAVILAKDRSVHQLITDKNMLWPDGVSYNERDGYMYVSAAQVNLGSVFNNGVDKSTHPFYIFRFKPLTKGVPYR